jgi:hypothetical protein
MIRTFVRSVAVVLVAVAGAERAALAQEVDLAGTYRCEGVSPSGKSYRTVVQIVKDDKTFVLRWLAREGSAIGIGILRDGLLSVSYFTGRDVGVVVYRIEKGPMLVGQWSLLGTDGQLYPETLTKVGLSAEAGDEAVGFAGASGSAGGDALAPSRGWTTTAADWPR